MEKPTNKVLSKTQAAFERRDISALTRIGIRKCLDLHPPVSTDSGAENFTHAHKRYRTNRYAWIEKWIIGELDHPRENDTGARLMTRLRWRLLDEVKKEYATKRRVAKAFDKVETERVVGVGRVHRERLPTREHVLDFLSTLDPPRDPVLRDLWERIIDTYPDWRLSTNRHLAAVYGVHPNVIASRRSALAVLYVDDYDELSKEQAFIVKHCLRLRAGVLRKTDIRRVEAEKGVFYTKLRKVGMVRRMDWRPRSHTGAAEGMPQFTPVYNCLGGAQEAASPPAAALTQRKMVRSAPTRKPNALSMGISEQSDVSFALSSVY